MRILVTGGAGFIGSAVVRRAIAAGHTVLNLDKLTYAGDEACVASAAESSLYTFEQADICDAAAVSGILACYRPNAVVHLAAETHVDRSIDGPADFIQTNVVGTSVLLAQTLAYWETLDTDARAGFRLLHVSTDEVYGDLEPEAAAFTERHPYAPSSPYAASKAASDHLVRAWARTYGLPVLITNCSNNYGPYQFPEKLIPLTVLNAIEGKPIRVYGQGDQVRDWLHVEDHARALELVLKKGVPGQTYNIGGLAERRNIDLVRQLCATLEELRPGGDYQRLITFVDDRPGHDRRYAMDISKIHRDLGWSPVYDLDRGLRDTLIWQLNNLDFLTRLRSRYDGGRLGLRRGSVR